MDRDQLNLVRSFASESSQEITSAPHFQGPCSPRQVGRQGAAMRRAEKDYAPNESSLCALLEQVTDRQSAHRVRHNINLGIVVDCQSVYDLSDFGGMLAIAAKAIAELDGSDLVGSPASPDQSSFQMSECACAIAPARDQHNRQMRHGCFSG